MKILMTSESYLPRIGGAEVHVNNLFTRLMELGHDVSLLTNEPGGDLDGVARIVWSSKTVVKNFFHIFRTSKGVSLIHSHYSHRLALLSGIAGKLRGIPVVITLHGMGILDHPSSSLPARLKHSFYRYWSLKLCTHVISTSEDLALVADRYIKRNKMTVIMNGYDADKFSATEKNDIPKQLNLEGKKLMVTVRRLVPKNGPHYLVEAMPIIVKRDPNVHYLVVGDGPLKNKMKKRADELGVDGNITFVGMVDNSQVVKYLAAADVVVFPSTAESSSIACAEAMGMGKMVVASRVGGLVELLGKQEPRGYLVDLVPWSGSNYDAPETLPVESYEKLADGVVKGMAKNQTNDSKKTEAMKYAKEELSWDAIIKKTILIYDKLLI